MSATLSCEGVTVRFGGHTALDDVHLEVGRDDTREIVGLIGPNGAGKTTLMECISGFQPVNSGRVQYRDHDLLRLSPSARAGLGIGRTLQNVRLFPYLTVLDNLRVALHRHQESGPVGAVLRLPAVGSEERRTLARAEELLDLLGLPQFKEKFASELSYGTLRLLELACMLALEPTMLLLDEPASGVSQKETEALGPLLRGIRDRTGASILLIEHDIPLVMSLCDRVYVLDAGQNLAEGTPEEVKSDARVIEAYLGTPRERARVQATVEGASAGGGATDEGDEILLRLSGIDVHYGKVQVLDGVNLHVRRGERVALLGTNGAGKSTVLRVASGLAPPSRGKVEWKGEDITGAEAEEIVKAGLGHVPGGRGMFPTLSVRENLLMGGWLLGTDKDKIDAALDRATTLFPWIAERLGQPAGTLSGGEQQQLACARALMTRPDVLMIDELSLGLAPIVVERLMETVERLHEEEGLTVVLVEQQATFALGYTDRAYFLEKGQVRYEGSSAGLVDRGDLLRSVFLAGAAEGFAAGEPHKPAKRTSKKKQKKQKVA